MGSHNVKQCTVSSAATHGTPAQCSASVCSWLVSWKRQMCVTGVQQKLGQLNVAKSGCKSRHHQSLGKCSPLPYLSKEFLSCLQPDFIIMNISAWPYFQLLHVLPAIKTVLSRLGEPLTAGLHFAVTMLNVYALMCVPDSEQ